VWTWTALDSDSKLIVSYLIGGRDGEYAMAFMDDLRSRLANRVQLTTDGHKAYLNAVDEAFGIDVDYAQLVKLYARSPTAITGKRRSSEVFFHLVLEILHSRLAAADPVTPANLARQVLVGQLVG